MYSVQGHGDMIGDAGRTSAYERALRAAIEPGTTVVADIGTGMGLFAMLAARFGARKVYAIESSDMIEVARAIAAANGCADRIEFIHAASTEIELAERADVILSDLRGVLPYFHGHIRSIVDARKRLLAPGGTLIPARDTMWVACVCAPDLHRTVTTPWLDNRFGFDMSVAHDLAANQWRRAVLRREQLVTPPACAGIVDYATVASCDYDGAMEMIAPAPGESHGIGAWFDAEIAPGIGLSNAPGLPQMIYGNAYFPWPEAIALHADDRIELRLRAKQADHDYMWTWESRILRDGKRVAQFRQSDYFSEPRVTALTARHGSA